MLKRATERRYCCIKGEPFHVRGHQHITEQIVRVLAAGTKGGWRAHRGLPAPWIIEKYGQLSNGKVMACTTRRESPDVTDETRGRRSFPFFPFFSFFPFSLFPFFPFSLFPFFPFSLFPFSLFPFFPFSSFFFLLSSFFLLGVFTQAAEHAHLARGRRQDEGLVELELHDQRDSKTGALTRLSPAQYLCTALGWR